MKERPILFSAPMVRALLAGTKTQTRRAMRLQPDDDASVTVEHYNATVLDKHGEEQPGPEIYGAWWHDGGAGLRCPYGAPGDLLWVKETFFAFGRWETRFSAQKGRDEWHFVDMTLETGRAYAFAAPAEYVKAAHKRGSVTPTWWKRPSIYMPRAASRITLEVTGVRVERLQEISEADAIDEGVAELPGQAAEPGAWWTADAGAGAQLHARTPEAAYRLLWESINGPGSWDANPWVWAVSFKSIGSP